MASPSMTSFVRGAVADRGPAVGALKPNCMCHLPLERALSWWPEYTMQPAAIAAIVRPLASLRRGSLVMVELSELMADAGQLRDRGHGRLISYSRKVFIPLTHLCRDVCHYCTFAERPRAGQPAYLSPDQVLAIARAGQAAGCTEALFTLGDKPELRYSTARDALAALGHETTLSYLAQACELVLKETGLLPHVNAGVMDASDIALLRRVSASQGLML